MKKKQDETEPLSIPRCPKPLKDALFEYARQKGQSGAQQTIIGLWDYAERLGIIKGGGGNRTRSEAA
jgi:hypothetical protein